jgi:hypothetical protein
MCILCIWLVSLNQHFDPKCTEWTSVRKKNYVVLIRSTEQPSFFAADRWTCDDKWGWLLTVDSSLTQRTGICFVVLKFSIYRSWGFKLAVQKPTLSTAVENRGSMAPTLLARSVPHNAMHMSVSADTGWFVRRFWWTIDCGVFPPSTIL